MTYLLSVSIVDCFSDRKVVPFAGSLQLISVSNATQPLVETLSLDLLCIC